MSLPHVDHATHIAVHIEKLIEVALPLEDINRDAVREKSIRHGHPPTLHVRWARRLLPGADLPEKRGSSPQLYRNTLVFLAADKTRLGELKSAVASFTAWKSIHDERESLGLDPFNAKLAEKR